MEDEVVFNSELFEKPEDALGLRVLSKVSRENWRPRLAYIQMVKGRQFRLLYVWSRHFE
jgi:hypothetical protein